MRIVRPQSVFATQPAIAPASALGDRGFIAGNEPFASNMPLSNAVMLLSTNG